MTDIELQLTLKKICDRLAKLEVVANGTWSATGGVTASGTNILPTDENLAEEKLRDIAKLDKRVSDLELQCLCHLHATALQENGIESRLELGRLKFLELDSRLAKLEDPHAR